MSVFFFFFFFFANVALIVLSEMFTTFLGLYKCLKLIYFNAAAKLHEFYCCSLLNLATVYKFLLLIEIMYLFNLVY